jgi:3',5'-cyclic AMP phosphodiesterase CpdA
MNKNRTPFFISQFLLAILLITNGTLWAQKDTLSILHITDLHVIFNQYAYIPEMMQYREKKQYNQGETRLRQFLEIVPEKTNSDMIVATGDLVDFFESETVDGSMLDIQPDQFSKLLNNYKTPVLLTLGNHDIFTFEWNDSLDYKLLHNQNFADKAKAQWIRNLSCFKNGTYYSHTFHVGKTTYRLIFLDDSFYQFLPEDKTEIPYIDKPQLYWLNAQLHESEDDIEIILMHIPLKNSVALTNPTNGLYSALSKNPSCKLILSGHEHKNVVTKFSLGGGNEVVQVQTGALVQNTENWRLVKLTENNILVSIPGKTEYELVIPVK